MANGTRWEDYGGKTVLNGSLWGRSELSLEVIPKQSSEGPLWVSLMKGGRKQREENLADIPHPQTEREGKIKPLWCENSVSRVWVIRVLSGQALDYHFVKDAHNTVVWIEKPVRSTALFYFLIHHPCPPPPSQQNKANFVFSPTGNSSKTLLSKKLSVPPLSTTA